MQTIKFIMRTRKFQKFWEALLALALYGMNKGPIDIATNGEAVLVEILARRMPKNAVVFDVGANKGDYTLALIRHFGQDARIFVFEPSARTFETLRRAVPHAPNVQLDQIGFGEDTDTIDLYADKPGSALASVYPRRIFANAREQSKEKVEIMRVDEYCRARHIDRINLLKLDVEGHELSVLKGCGDLLTQRKIDVIQFEFGGCNVDSRTFFKDFFDLLTPDYSLFRMVADGLVPLNEYRESYEIFGTNNLVAASDLKLLAGMY
jgi:FkbM family methyltransferase